MKLRATMLFSLVFINFTLNVYAAPFPLGFELGKAKLNDIEKKFKLKQFEPSACDDLLINYRILNPALSNLPGLEEAWFTVNNDNIIQDFSLTIHRDQYDSVFKSLSEKYKIVKTGMVLGCKQIFFANEGSEIVLVRDTDNLRSSINVYYHSPVDLLLTKKCQKRAEENYKKKQAREKEQQKKLL